MKQKLFVRVICIVLAAVLIGSVAMVAITAFTAQAAVPIKNSLVSSSVSAGSSGYVCDDYVNLRSGAGTSYSVVECLRENTKFTFVDGKIYNTDWFKIKVTSTSKTGYVHKDYIKTSQTTTTGYICDDYVNLRSGAGTSYSIVDCLRENTKFTFISMTLYNTNWYNIKLSDGTTGYVHKDYIKQSSTSSTSTTTTTTSTVTGYITGDYVNLRSGAGTSYSIVECLKENTKFTFVSTTLYNTDWYKIKLSDGTTGYVHKDYVKKDTASSSSNTTTTTSGSVKLSETSKTIYTGNVYALTATCSGTVSWSSSNTSVATVSGGVVTAKSAGSTTITAKSGSYSATCKITVKSGSSVNISNTKATVSLYKSIRLSSSTSGVKWSSSNTSLATVDSNGIVDTKGKGKVTIMAYTSSGAATCLIEVVSRDSIRFCYASPNSAPLNSKVTFKAITDTDRIDVRFVVSNGSTSYTIYADSKVKDGNTYIWSASKVLSKSGKWDIKAYSKFKTSTQYCTTDVHGQGEAFVTTTKDKTTTVCAERRASDEVIKFISENEGYLSSVTPDYITSDPTLGYGKVVWPGEQFYNNITKNEAFAYLFQTVNDGDYTVKTNKFLLDNGVKFNQQQFDALVSFTYNFGVGVLYNDSELNSALLNTSSSTISVAAGLSGYVNSEGVNLRSGAGTSYSIVTNMSYGTAFTFVDGKKYNSNWYKIKLSDGTTGYIHKSYASVKGTGTRDLNNVNKDELIDIWLQYHHAAGSCYWGLLYRRVDEMEMFFIGDYVRDGSYNYNHYKFTCYSNSSFKIS